MRLKTAIRADVEQEVQSLRTELEQAKASSESLKEHLKDITASNEHLHDANLSLQDRIHRTESACITRAQTSATEHAILHKADTNLEQQLKHLIENFEQFKRESTAAEGQHHLELAGMRNQIERLGLTTDADRPGKAGPWRTILPTKIQSCSADLAVVTKTFSEATTMDDDPGKANGSPEGFCNPQKSKWTISQGKRSYKEYLELGESFIQEAEAQAVKTYVQGMKSRFRRQPVWDALEKKGWTWQNARREIQRIVDEGKKRLQNRRTIQDQDS